MAMITDASLVSDTEADGLAFAREVLRIEAEALDRVREQLGDSIARAAELIHRSTGSVIVTGMGNAGLVGQKLAADFVTVAEEQGFVDADLEVVGWLSDGRG